MLVRLHLTRGFVAVEALVNLCTWNPLNMPTTRSKTTSGPVNVDSTLSNGSNLSIFLYCFLTNKPHNISELFMCPRSSLMNSGWRPLLCWRRVDTKYKIRAVGINSFQPRASRLTLIIFYSSQIRGERMQNTNNCTQATGVAAPKRL